MAFVSSTNDRQTIEAADACDYFDSRHPRLAGMFKALLLGLLVVIASASSQTTVQVRIFNRAQVRNQDLDRARAEVVRLFAAEEIEVKWMEEIVEERNPLLTDFTAGLCSSVTERQDVEIQLLAKAPRGLPESALGYSLPDPAFG